MGRKGTYAPTPGAPENASSQKRTDDQRAADELLIEYYVVRGYTTAKIKPLLAAQRPYRLSGTMIDNIRRGIRERWRKEATAELQSFIDAELAGLKHQEEELWAAWERSQKDAESETVETIHIKAGKHGKKKKVPGERVTKQRTGQVGGVQFQNAILEIRAQRRSLMGLDQPKKIASTTPDGENAAPLVVCVTPDEMPVAKKP